MRYWYMNRLLAFFVFVFVCLSSAISQIHNPEFCGDLSIEIDWIIFAAEKNQSINFNKYIFRDKEGGNGKYCLEQKYRIKYINDSIIKTKSHRDKEYYLLKDKSFLNITSRSGSPKHSDYYSSRDSGAYRIETYYVSDSNKTTVKSKLNRQKKVVEQELWLNNKFNSFVVFHYRGDSLWKTVSFNPDREKLIRSSETILLPTTLIDGLLTRSSETSTFDLTGEEVTGKSIHSVSAKLDFDNIGRVIRMENVNRGDPTEKQDFFRIKYRSRKMRIKT
jgi:hypothetical protein